jgi:hypothetical protein
MNRETIQMDAWSISVSYCSSMKYKKKVVLTVYVIPIKKRLFLAGWHMSDVWYLFEEKDEKVSVKRKTN